MRNAQVRMVDGRSPKIQALANSTTAASLEESRFSWVGMIDEEIICLWGLIPHSLLSDDAVLWLHVTDKFEGNEFIFVRHSQEVIKNLLLMEYPVIRGHVLAANGKAIRWLRWLGAEFGPPEEDWRIPFAIWSKDQ